MAMKRKTAPELEVNITRAWKDREYRESLNPEQLAKLPPNPAGEVELDEIDLENVAAGGKVTSAACFTGDKASPNNVFS